MNALQGTQEWLDERAGHATASEFKTIMVAGKCDSGFGTGAMSYADKLIAERLIGKAIDGGGSVDTSWGSGNERSAIIEYQDRVGVTVQDAPFCRYALLDWCGGSPDGFVGENGLVEVKCPGNSANHIHTVRADQMPGDHVAQVQGNLWVTGRDWCDFLSYDPRLPCSRFFSQRIERDDVYIAKLAERVAAFLDLVAKWEAYCRER